MQKIRWLLYSILLIAAIGITLCVLFPGFFYSIWWFKSLGYETYFWLRLLYRYIVFIAATLIFFLFFFFNFRIASKSAGSETGRNRSFLLKPKIYIPFSILLSVPMAFPITAKWEQALLYVFGQNSGIYDPVYGKDISYYLFSFPVHSLVQKEILAAFSFLFLILTITYWFRSRSSADRRFSAGAKIHLTLLMLLIFLIQAYGYRLQQIALLYIDRNQPAFFGPGTMEMDFFLPLIWGSLFLFMATGLSFILLINTRKGLKAFFIFGFCFLLTLAIRESPILRKLAEDTVRSDNIVKEKPFIANSITGTSAAFGLDRIKISDYPANQSRHIKNFDKIAENIPLWDKALLKEVYTQQQGIRPFYAFTEIDTDRYVINNAYRQVYIAVRELNLAGLPESDRGWLDIHLRYSHGYAAVMTPAAITGEKPLTNFIQDGILTSAGEFEIRQPRVYYGLSKAYTYTLAPNTIGETEPSDKDKDKKIHYAGQGGVHFSSLFRKLMFALYFKDERLFFIQQQIGENTRILFRQNIAEQIQILTPFFVLDRKPYPVISDEGIFWVQDAYTVSDRYPNAESYNGRFNYIRNSVKIVVNAYNGKVNYYISDPDDPIIRAYSRIYPGLLKPLEEMPSEIRSHLRYPQDLFEIQMLMYARYHQTDAEKFFRNTDLWDFAGISPEKSSYLTLPRHDSDQPEFVLSAAMKSADSLSAFVTAACDKERYGQITVFKFPKEILVPGISRINSLIDGNPDIARELLLSEKSGGKVKRGSMIFLPIDGIILYIQPVYVTMPEEPAIPELKHVIVGTRDSAAMAGSIEEALQKLGIGIEKPQ